MNWDSRKKISDYIPYVQGTMATFLLGISEIIIQQVGCWSSFAFLGYIREQVDSFSIGVSQQMLLDENVYHLNEKESNQLDNEEKSNIY